MLVPKYKTNTLKLFLWPFQSQVWAVISVAVVVTAVIFTLAIWVDSHFYVYASNEHDAVNMAWCAKTAFWFICSALLFQGKRGVIITAQKILPILCIYQYVFRKSSVPHSLQCQVSCLILIFLDSDIYVKTFILSNRVCLGTKTSRCTNHVCHLVDLCYHHHCRVHSQYDSTAGHWEDSASGGDNTRTSGAERVYVWYSSECCPIHSYSSMYCRMLFDKIKFLVDRLMLRW